MPEEQEAQTQPASLPSRIEQYRKEVEYLVGVGTEHPRYEMKRECSIANENMKSRLGFVKLVQGLANAHLKEERFVIIGADQKERKFFSVQNADEFDPAKISAILGRYLAPLPNFEVFNALTSTDGSRFVLVVLAASQPRPILVKADAKSSDGSLQMRKGEIWIKENTALRPGTREDIDSMYRERIDAEADSRAQARFAVLRDELVAQLRMSPPSGPRIPTKGLLFDKDQEFRLFVEQLVGMKDDRPFLMLIENLRDILVEGWHKVDAFTPGSPPDLREFVAKVTDHKKNQFLPALRRLVETGLLLVKHDVRRPALKLNTYSANWFEGVVALLVEVFETAHRLERLKSIQPWKDVGQIETDEELSHWVPALEALIGARTLAIYAIKRGRYEFLVPLLKRFVRPVGNTSRKLQPFCFWPLSMPLGMTRGVTLFCWESRIQNSWGEYFGNRESFLESACQYEFVIELNSFIGVGLAGKRSKIEEWLREYRPGVSFAYSSDLVLYDLAATVPVAEKLYEALERGPDDWLIVYLTVEKSLTDLLLKEAIVEDRLFLLGRYLRYLTKAQREYYLYQGNFPPEFNWGDRLEGLTSRLKAEANGEQK
jgi:hypothetical protein